MRPFRVEAPQGALVPVEELRQQVRADTDEQDELILAYERAAVDFLDGYSGRLGRCILRQKWALPLVGTPDAVFLPFPDCREFAIERLDDQGVWSDVAGVTVTGIDDCALLMDLPSDQAGLHLTCWAGWATAEDVPGNLKQAVRLLVAHWFDNRAAVTTGQAPHQVPMAVDAMIAPLVHVFV
jgi:hypothetical protein